MSNPIDLTTLANVKQWLSIPGSPISSISQANPAVVTLIGAPSYPLMTGQGIAITGANGISDANADWIITVISQPVIGSPTGNVPTSFSIPLDSTALGPYTSGGYAGVTDSLLQRLITAASQAILSLITSNILPQSYTETRNGLGGTAMVMKQTPIISVEGVMVDGITMLPRPPLGPYPITTNGAIGYVFDNSRVMLVGGYFFCPGAQNVVIQYTAGYNPYPPYDLEQACIDTIGDWFKYRDRIGKLSEGIEGQTITFTNQMIPARAKAIINTYNSVAPVY